MPRPRPPYLSHERTRHSKSVWYVRRNGKRVRIKAAFGTPEFDAEYQAAIAGTSSGTSSTRAATTKAAHGTLAWLIDRYRETIRLDVAIAGNAATTATGISDNP